MVRPKNPPLHGRVNSAQQPTGGYSGSGVIRHRQLLTLRTLMRSELGNICEVLPRQRLTGAARRTDSNTD